MKATPNNPSAASASSLILYGAFLLWVGLAAVMYDPKSGQFGFNAAAKTALISGGICGGLSILWGLFAGAGARWALWAALGSTALFLAAFTWRATVAWIAFLGGATDKWYASTLITMMALASVALLIRISRTLFARDKDRRQTVAIETGTMG